MATKKTVTENKQPLGKVYDFRKLPLENIIGEIEEQDLSKAIANCYYNRTADIGQLDKARTIYYKGQVELTDEECSLLERFVLTSDLPAVVQVGVQKILGKEV